MLAHAEAVELFTTRAQDVAAGRCFDPALTGAICQRLDCLPLAIELAAARTKALSPSEILTRLDNSLVRSTGGPRDAPQRQRTLRATIDWSYELLDREEQELFARLAVFAGGCTLGAAQAVCHAGLDALQSLVDRGLVRSDGLRYWMLQMLREYALERLAQARARDEVQRAHAQWLIEMLDAEGLSQPGWPDKGSLDHVAPERENCAAALRWASSHRMNEIVARLTSPMVGVWIMTGQLHEAERWMTLVLEHESEYQGRLAAQVATSARILAWHRGHHADGAVLAQRALALGGRPEISMQSDQKPSQSARRRARTETSPVAGLPTSRRSSSRASTHSRRTSWRTR